MATTPKPSAAATPRKATLKHPQTGHEVTTGYAPEIVSLRAQGYRTLLEVEDVEAPAETASADVEPKTAATASKPKSSK